MSSMSTEDVLQEPDPVNGTGASDEVDLELAFALERLILGSQLRLSCNCILDVFCTMPVTYWMRLIRYDHRCPWHPRGSNHLLRGPAPAWVTTEGELIDRDEFTVTFNKLARSGRITLIPGITFDQGRQQHPSVISLEGGHFIGPRGNTQKIPINME